jgi:hypothetical protein
MGVLNHHYVYVCKGITLAFEVTYRFSQNLVLTLDRWKLLEPHEI